MILTPKDAIIKQLKGLQLSDSTITRRVEDQMLTDLRGAPCYSMAVDENTDVTVTAQLNVCQVPQRRFLSRGNAMFMTNQCTNWR